MNFREFSKKMRLRAKLGEDGEAIVAGRAGEIYQYDRSLLALLLMPRQKFVWANARRKLEAVGCTILQDGDEEGAATFNPENPAQARLVLRLVGCKRTRRQTGKGRPFTSERVKELARIRLKTTPEKATERPRSLQSSLGRLGRGVRGKQPRFMPPSQHNTAQKAALSPELKSWIDGVPCAVLQPFFAGIVRR